MALARATITVWRVIVPVVNRLGNLLLILSSTSQARYRGFGQVSPAPEVKTELLFQTVRWFSPFQYIDTVPLMKFRTFPVIEAYSVPQKSPLVISYPSVYKL